MLTNHPNMLGRGATASSASIGDVDGPASSTDNAITRFDGTTGKLIQNSVAILNDGTLTGSSGTSTFLSLPFTANQSGTAGYTGLSVIATETATGSGTKLLARFGTGASNNLVTINNAGLTRTTLFAVGSSGTPDATFPAIVHGDRNGDVTTLVQNDQAGTAARAVLTVQSDSASGGVAALSGSYTTSGLAIADSVRFVASTNASGGLVLAARASAPVIIGTNDTERARFTSGGNFVLAPVSLTQAAPTVIDFDLANERDITLTGDIEFTTSNLAAGRSVTIYITADGSERTFTFPAWVFVGTEPTTIAASKRAVLTLSARSTTDASVRAAYSVEA